MKKIIRFLSDMISFGIKVRCPFCGEAIRVEYSLSVCPSCLSTIKYDKEPTRKVSHRDIRPK